MTEQNPQCRNCRFWQQHVETDYIETEETRQVRAERRRLGEQHEALSWWKRWRTKVDYPEYPWPTMEPVELKLDEGTCRLRPVSGPAEGEDENAAFAVTKRTDWCAGFEVRKGDPAFLRKS